MSYIEPDRKGTIPARVVFAAQRRARSGRSILVKLLCGISISRSADGRPLRFQKQYSLRDGRRMRRTAGISLGRVKQAVQRLHSNSSGRARFELGEIRIEECK